MTTQTPLTQRLTRRSAPRARPSTQQGLSMILALVFLVVMTMLGGSMFRSYTLLEKVAGNTMDKQRSFEAAQSALRYAEWWLGDRGTAPLVVPCAGVADLNVTPEVPVCDSPLATATQVPWTGPRAVYTPNFMTISSGGGLSGAGDVNYSSRPNLHVHFLGMQADGVTQVYQVTATASGGHAASVSVVQSALALAPPVKDLGTP